MKDHDLLVRIQAVAVNPVDYKIRNGTAGSHENPNIFGWDASGVVERIGSKVTLFSPGDSVFYAGDIRRSGTNAEVHAVDERIVGRAPRCLSPVQAAALPLTSITAWESLFDRLNIQADKSPSKILIIGSPCHCDCLA